jgi:hypothetical protein
MKKDEFANYAENIPCSGQPECKLAIEQLNPVYDWNVGFFLQMQ